MPELFCEEIAHRAGFVFAIGNWIAPDGGLITGKDHNTHHRGTLEDYFGHKSDNPLELMNEKVSEVFMRLVFRHDVLFQVGCLAKEEIWGEAPNCKRLVEVLQRIPEVEVHIFSRTFYIVGKAGDVVAQEFSRLQIQEDKC